MYLDENISLCMLSDLKYFSKCPQDKALDSWDLQEIPSFDQGAYISL